MEEVLFLSERNYYMVRAMLSNEEDFRTFFDNSVVAVGWSKIDFTKFQDVKQLRDAVCEEYYSNDTVQQVVSKKLNEVERFKSIKRGDYIIIPYNSYIAIAEAGDTEIYSETAKNLDLSNQIEVSYRYDNGELLTIPRNDLSEGLQRRLRVRGNTVSNLFEFKEEIERIFRRKSYSYSSEIQKLENVELEKLRKGLLESIQNGKTNLQTGGIGLENLICELMECEGYSAQVLAKTKFTGKADADIRAIKEDAFMSKKIFVQVKHHSGYSGVEGIKQIIDVLEQDEYKEYDGYFITSALVEDNVRDYATKHNIEVMDGEELVKLIINNLNKLSETTKRKLGICGVPRMLTLK